jgi:hypothetical protein
MLPHGTAENQEFRSLGDRLDAPIRAPLLDRAGLSVADHLTTTTPAGITRPGESSTDAGSTPPASSAAPLPPSLKSLLSMVYVLTYEAHDDISAALEHATAISEQVGSHVRPQLREARRAIDVAIHTLASHLDALGCKARRPRTLLQNAFSLPDTPATAEFLGECMHGIALYKQCDECIRLTLDIGDLVLGEGYVIESRIMRHTRKHRGDA